MAGFYVAGALAVVMMFYTCFKCSANNAQREDSSKKRADQAAVAATEAGSLAVPIHNASSEAAARALDYVRNNPPRPLALDAQILKRMASPANWSFVVPPDHDAFVSIEDGTRVTLFGQPISRAGLDTDLAIVPNLPLPLIATEPPATADATATPGPTTRAILYFEVTVVNMDPQTTVAVGLTTAPWPTFRLPGWNAWSVGYHSDDGRCYSSDDGQGVEYSKPYRIDDVIGVGVNTGDWSVFFTRNGVKLATVSSARVPAPRLAVHPAIGANGRASLEVNFGTWPFKWEPANEGQFGLALDVLLRYSVNA
ncbi:hypothetical protein H9P43_002501 [Blastocladiella emersonii ATCC 22665]|nr:hypothetical protein H9P43_002501 [Blastocladiella emersonii ATCC 22665]